MSDLAAIEFASAVARRVRTREITPNAAREAYVLMDEWSGGPPEREHATTADFIRAETYLRSLDLTLRTQDALHVAMASRLDAVLATFDRKLALCAARLGLPVEPAP